MTNLLGTQAIVKLKDEGYSERTIARRVGGIGRTAVGRWLKEGKPLEYKPYPHTGRGQLATFVPYLRARLEDHDANTKQIFAELVARGFTGSHSSVYRFAALYRAGLKADTPASQVRIPPDAVRYSAREGVWMFLRDPDKLNPEELERLEHLRVTVPESNRVLDLVRRFRTLVRSRPSDAERTLLTWLAEAHACGVLELDRFAKGVHGDLAAVVAGLRLAWSNGQVEGQVTRLKLIKRSMYGRAKFDLLRARVLLA
jgi:transposase